MGQVTHEQANLLLRLYELRREPRLREARSWFIANFHARNLEERAKNYPPGSDGDTNVRMVVSYWDMAAALVNRGLIDDELFFETSGEAWIVWDRLREITPIIRRTFKNPHYCEHLERLVKRMEEWQVRRAPGHMAAMRQVMSGGRQSPARAAGE